MTSTPGPQTSATTELSLLVKIAVASKDFPIATHADHPPDLVDSFNIFSAFTDLPFENPDLLLYGFPAIDTKTDTLTQSQMLRDPDKVKFLQAQQPEIKGLQQMKVFDIKPISTKPKDAKLLLLLSNILNLQSHQVDYT
jgi:hypothetical protein